MRTMTLKELVFEELNRQLAEEGRDVRVVAERPKPRLVAEVVQLQPASARPTMENGYGK
jgi:hypothetical protein